MGFLHRTRQSRSMQSLLDSHADVEMADHLGLQPLQMACDRNLPPVGWGAVGRKGQCRRYGPGVGQSDTMQCLLAILCRSVA